MNSIWKRFSPSRFSLTHVGVDVVLLVAAMYMSLWMRLGESQWSTHVGGLNRLVIGFVLIRVLMFLGFGVYQSLWRYISTHDATRLSGAVIASVPLLMSLTYLFPQWYLPRSLFFIDAFVSTALLMGIRLFRRRLFELNMQPHRKQVTLGRLIIYGAGQNGRLLAQRLLSDPARDRALLGFVDDSPVMKGKFIHGLPVLGNHNNLEEILTQTQCTELVVAITTPPPDLMRELVLMGRRKNIRIQRIAHFDEAAILARGEALYQQVELKDLLHRPAVQVDLPLVKNILENKIVLVTGAGGTIGSELCRQIARFSPGKLLMLDHSELNLYNIDQELRPSSQDIDRIVPILADIKDQNSLNHIFAQYNPQVVFHAAAYKHVHLVEANVNSAVINNVQGTLNLLNTAQQFAVTRFVMISSDKAVNPIGAMGSTKRVCELITTAFGLRNKLAYSSVRFGNVLGSSGSLIPLLQKQIENGGPVTVTHPDMTRYFMLIPEAVSLVLMSATLSKPGDVNVLKMGEPVKIIDLAKSLMALMGKTESDLSIAFTGIRPGEKMYEELYLTGKEIATRHPDILTMPGGDLANPSDEINLLSQVNDLIALAQKADARSLDLLVGLANHRADQTAAPEFSHNH